MQKSRRRFFALNELSMEFSDSLMFMHGGYIFIARKLLHTFAIAESLSRTLIHVRRESEKWMTVFILKWLMDLRYMMIEQ